MSSLCSYSIWKLGSSILKFLSATFPCLILKIICKSPLLSLTFLLFSSSDIFLHHCGSFAFSTNLVISSFSSILATYWPLTPYPLCSYKSYHFLGTLPLRRRTSSSLESSESRRLISYFSSRYYFSCFLASCSRSCFSIRLSDFLNLGGDSSVDIVSNFVSYLVSFSGLLTTFSFDLLALPDTFGFTSILECLSFSACF